MTEAENLTDFLEDRLEGGADPAEIVAALIWAAFTMTSAHEQHTALAVAMVDAALANRPTEFIQMRGNA